MSISVLFQKQPNCSDCGLFAIANAMAIVNGQNPELLHYDVGVMRKHLAGCLEDRVITHFHAKKRATRKMTRRTEVMKVYCVCRMPEEGGEKMISCDTCQQWFHDQCVSVPTQAWLDKDFVWKCSDCVDM